MVFGWCYGSMNDIQIYYLSPYYNNFARYIGNTNVLFDGVMDFVQGPFLCPIRNPSSLGHVVYNYFQRNGRVIIENVFGRIKLLWPLVGLKYNLHLNLLGITYFNCVLLTNIIIIHQDPMRNNE